MLSVAQLDDLGSATLRVYVMYQNTSDSCQQCIIIHTASHIYSYGKYIRYFCLVI